MTVERTAERNAERNALARRRRRLIFNNDGDDLLSMRPDEHDSAAEALLRERTTALWGSQVDSIWYYSTHGMRLHHSGGPLGRLYGCPDPDGTATANYRRLLAEGTDALEVMIDACRQHGVEIFYSNRMNDCHDAFDDSILYHIRRQHPEWSLSTREQGRRHRYPEIRSLWTAWNFEVDAIRDLTVEAMREVCRTYDIDGIELDFWRFTCYFPESIRHEPVTPAHRDLMTDLVRRIRQAVDEEADRRGRPILLAGRCVADQEISRNAGLDVEAWLQEGLVDLLSLAYGTNHIPPIGPLATLAHRYGTPLYPILAPHRKTQPSAIGVEHAQKFEHYGNLPAWRGVARALRAQGADGFQLFNFFNPTRPQWWQVGEEATMTGKDTVYEWDFLPSQRDGCRTFADLRLTRDRWPVDADAEGTEPLPLFLGEEVAQPPAGTAKRRTAPRHAALCVHITGGLTRHHHVWLTVNDARLDAWRPAAPQLLTDDPVAAWIEFHDGLQAFRKGRNEIQVFVRSTSPAAAASLTIDRIQLELTY